MTILNPYGILASLYRHTYLTNKLPNSGCDYIWELLFAVLILPLTWTVIAYNIKEGNIYQDDYYDYETKETTLNYNVSYSSEKPFNGILYTLAFLVLGVIFLGCLSKGNLFGKELDVYLSHGFFVGIVFVYFVGLIGLITFVSAVVGIVYCIIWLIKQIPDKKEKPYDYEAERLKAEKNSNKKPNLFQLVWIGIVAYKEKKCPVIIWDYKKIKSEE